MYNISYTEMDEIIDEVPPLDTIPGDTVTIHMVLMDPRATIHSMTNFFVMSVMWEKKSFNKEEVKAKIKENDIKLLGLSYFMLKT